MRRGGVLVLLHRRACRTAMGRATHDRGRRPDADHGIRQRGSLRGCTAWLISRSVADTRTFALQSRTLLLFASNGTPIDVSLGAIAVRGASGRAKQRVRDRGRAHPPDVLGRGPDRSQVLRGARQGLARCFAGLVLRRGAALDERLIWSELRPLLELKEDPQHRGALEVAPCSRTARRLTTFAEGRAAAFVVAFARALPWIKDRYSSLIAHALRDGASVRSALAADCDSIFAAAQVVTESLRAGGKLLIFGNGGSAADAQHISAELVGRFTVESPPHRGRRAHHRYLCDHRDRERLRVRARLRSSGPRPRCSWGRRPGHLDERQVREHPPGRPLCEGARHEGGRP